MTTESCLAANSCVTKHVSKSEKDFFHLCKNELSFRGTTDYTIAAIARKNALAVQCFLKDQRVMEMG